MTKQVKPVVGMKATEYLVSDRHVYTIVKVKSDRLVIVKRDQVRRIDNNGMSEDQVWECTPDPKAREVAISLRKNGKWYVVGNSMSSCPFYLNVEHEYFDYSF